MLGKHDDDVQDWIKRVRINGGVINNCIVMAGAEAIMTKLAKHKLEKYGGHVTITKTYARSLLRRMGFVKRKGTKSVKVLPSDFDEIKRKYIEWVGKCANENKVPDEAGDIKSHSSVRLSVCPSVTKTLTLAITFALLQVQL